MELNDGHILTDAEVRLLTATKVREMQAELDRLRAESKRQRDGIEAIAEYLEGQVSAEIFEGDKFLAEEHRYRVVKLRALLEPPK